MFSLIFLPWYNPRGNVFAVLQGPSRALPRGGNNCLACGGKCNPQAVQPVASSVQSDDTTGNSDYPAFGGSAGRFFFLQRHLLPASDIIDQYVHHVVVPLKGRECSFMNLSQVRVYLHFIIEMGQNTVL